MPNLFRRLGFILIAGVGLILLVVDLRVDGDSAVVATPVWHGAGSAGLGTVLVVVALVMMRRARKEA